MILVIFIETIFGPPPSPPPPFINFVHGSHMKRMDIIGHVSAAPGPLAAALDPLACPSRSARPRNCPNLTLT